MHLKLNVYIHFFHLSSAQLTHLQDFSSLGYFQLMFYGGVLFGKHNIVTMAVAILYVPVQCQVSCTNTVCWTVLVVLSPLVSA